MKVDNHLEVAGNEVLSLSIVDKLRVPIKTRGGYKQQCLFVVIGDS